MNNTMNSHISASVTNEPITIIDHKINQVDGLYCLNDLHVASGGSTKHQPALFVRNKQTNDLINEIEHSTDMQSAIRSVNGGQNRGTYACKQLVIAYAAWISPKFNLAVIDAFLDKQEPNQFYIPQTLPEALQLAAKQAEEIEAAKPKLVAFNRIAEAEGSMNITQTAKTLQIKPNKLFTWLGSNGWTYRRVGSGDWTAYQERIDTGHLEHKVTTMTINEIEKVFTQVRVTPKGLAKLGQMIGGVQ